MRLRGRADAYLVYVGVGVILLGAVNVIVLPGDLGMVSVQPHPALGLVAIIAARYGLREGLMAAVVTGALLLAASLARSPEVTGRLLRTPDTYATPLFLLATGLVLGAIRAGARREIDVLNARIGELEGELADQAVRFLAGAEAKLELERRVADETASLSSLYAASLGMESLSSEELYPAIIATTRRFLLADACQLYLLDGKALRLRAADGAPAAQAELPLDDGLAAFAIQRGTPASIRDYALVASLEDLQRAPVLLAAPVKGMNGELLGCVTVTRLSFLKLTPLSLDRLALVADWAGRALSNASAHEAVRARMIEDEVIPAYTYLYYQERLEEEAARADRFSHPLSVIVFRIHQLEDVGTERRRELGGILARIFARQLHHLDLVCRYATEDSFAIILPETPRDEAELVASRIAEEVRNFHFLPYQDETRELELSTRVIDVREHVS